MYIIAFFFFFGYAEKRGLGVMQDLTCNLVQKCCAFRVNQKVVGPIAVAFFADRRETSRRDARDRVQ